MSRLKRAFVLALPISTLVLLVLLALASAPHSVLAAPFIVVDNNGDASGGGCTLAPADCSLRSAIQMANASSGRTIIFSSDFTITLASAMPGISAPDTTIDAGLFTINVDANNTGPIFSISGDRVLINGLHTYGTAVNQHQIVVTGSAVGVKIANNVIGSDSAGGACILPNAHGGILVNATGGSLAGARVWIYGNTIKCHVNQPGSGITLDGTDHVLIGEDAASNAGPAQSNLIGNNGAGIEMLFSAGQNSVRNSTIFKNGTGVYIENSSFNVVMECAITGGSTGVWITNGSEGNQIGSPAGGPVTRGNTISDNAVDGVYISYGTTFGNLVYGNRIGTDASGSVALSNGRNGVTLDDHTHDNLIGATDLERNIISGNVNAGVLLTATAFHNAVAGNYIGTNISGTLAIPNASGIIITATAQSNTIGGTLPAAANLIGGNSAYGVYLSGSGTTTNTVSYNAIGYNSGTGGIFPNGLDNISLADGANSNIIGGIDAANVIVYALGNGIHLSGGAAQNQILKNYVQLNRRNGVLFEGVNTEGNVISRTIIGDNGGVCTGCDGIAERIADPHNRWTEIRTYGNAGLGIDKFTSGDTSNGVDAPYLRVLSINPSTGVVTGTSYATDFQGSTKVELYRIALDPSGYGEGGDFVGSAFTDSLGNWTITDPGIALNAPCYTAFETTELFNILFGSQISSSEFSRNNCSVFLPLIQR